MRTMAMRVDREYQRIAEELLTPEKATWRWDKGSKHPILVFTLNGKEWKFPMPGSSSDPSRTYHHTRAKLQRKIRCIKEGRLYGGCS